jgi:hypothetical protein
MKKKNKYEDGKMMMRVPPFESAHGVEGPLLHRLDTVVASVDSLVPGIAALIISTDRALR